MILKCENLKKSYGDFCAIRKINYSFTPGVYGLLGPNGAGKSTWMKLLTASLKPTKGQILCDEMSIYDNINEYVGKIGYVPQNQNMFPYFTGYKFMMYMATLKGVKKEVARKQIPELLKCVNMEVMGKQKIKTYSGGMKQRLLIAQAFLGDPKVVFMDEPTAGLDPKERIRIRNLISEMALGKIVLIATHIVSDVEYISKEILLLKHGEIIGSGNPESLEKELYGIVYEKKVTVEQLTRRRKELGNTYENGNIAPIPGIVPLIQGLRQSGVKTALVSSTATHLIIMGLNRMQMTDLFDVIVCGDMCAERKPDPECYLKAMGLLGAVPQECLVFEDSSVGIHAAKQAGIEVAAFTGSGNGQDVSEADYVVSSYEESKRVLI